MLSHLAPLTRTALVTAGSVAAVAAVGAGALFGVPAASAALDSSREATRPVVSVDERITSLRLPEQVPFVGKYVRDDRTFESSWGQISNVPGQECTASLTVLNVVTNESSTQEYGGSNGRDTAIPPALLPYLPAGPCAITTSLASVATDWRIDPAALGPLPAAKAGITRWVGTTTLERVAAVHDQARFDLLSRHKGSAPSRAELEQVAYSTGGMEIMNGRTLVVEADRTGRVTRVAHVDAEHNFFSEMDFNIR